MAKAGRLAETSATLERYKGLRVPQGVGLFARIFGLQIVGTIEERPGIPPGPQHVKELTENIKARRFRDSR